MKFVASKVVFIDGETFINSGEFLSTIFKWLLVIVGDNLRQITSNCTIPPAYRNLECAFLQ